MATTIVGKLNKDAKQFQAGESIGFSIGIGVKYYDRESKSDAWTNYSCVIFAKQPRQVEFYQSALVAGSIVEVTGQKLAIKQFQGNNGLSLSIELLDASIGFIGTAGAPQSQGNQPQQSRPQHNTQPQGGYGQHSNQSNKSQVEKENQWDDDIPW